MKKIGLLIAMILCMILLPHHMAKASVMYSGSCGENVKWKLDSDGILTISGTGPMKEYDYVQNPKDGVYYKQDTPWYDYSSEVNRVVVQKGVTTIGYGAFEACSRMTSVEIPEGVKKIGNTAFIGCRSLSEIKLPESVTSIGYAVFMGCSKLNSIDLPDTITSIGNQAFQDTPIEKIIFPKSLTKIGEYVFHGCKNLEYVKINTKLTKLGAGDFWGCYKLTNIEIPKNIDEIGAGSFAKTGLSSITIPETVTSIGGGAFENCKNLTKVKIMEGVKSIGGESFDGCKNLKKIIIPKSVTSMGMGKYKGNYSYYYSKPFDMETTVYMHGSTKLYQQYKQLPEKMRFKLVVPKHVKASLATITADGAKEHWMCKLCNKAYADFDETTEIRNAVIPAASQISLSQKTLTYNGRVQKPTVYVKNAKGKTISKTHYTLKWSSGCKNAGDYKAKVIFNEKRYTGTKTIRFTIEKARQRIFASNYTKRLGDEPFTIDAKRTKGNGRLTFVSDNTSVASIDAKGKVTIKGVGIAHIKITASATANYVRTSKRIKIEVNR